MKNIYIRVDAYKEIGIGHLTRCLALAEMLKNDFEITFLCQNRDENTLRIIEKNGFKILKLRVQELVHDLSFLETILSSDDLLVLDGYHFGQSYQGSLRKKVASLIFIDDMNNENIDADLIINHNLHAINETYHVPQDTRVIKGADYLLLRPEFLNPLNKRKSIPEKINSVVVCMGGADRGNLTLKIAQDLQRFFLNKITLIVGSAYAYAHDLKTYCQDYTNLLLKQNLTADELVQELKLHDLLICTSSMIAAEACAIGIPMIIGHMEKNQEKIAHIFHEKNLAYSLGDLTLGNYDLENTFKKVKMSEQLKLQAEFVDGNSPDRILSEFKRLSFKNLKLETPCLFLRPLRLTDVSDQYVLWFQNEDTKRFITTAELSNTKEKLISYVSDKISQPDVLFLGIFDKETGQHIGNIKFEPINWEKRFTIMGILIGEKSYRGKGISSEVLQATARYLKKIGMEKMVLGVEIDNIAAIKSYEKTGFVKTDGIFIKFKDSDKAIEMILNLT